MSHRAIAGLRSKQYGKKYFLPDFSGFRLFYTSCGVVGSTSMTSPKFSLTTDIVSLCAVTCVVIILFFQHKVDSFGSVSSFSDCERIAGAHAVYHQSFIFSISTFVIEIRHQGIKHKKQILRMDRQSCAELVRARRTRVIEDIGKHPADLKMVRVFLTIFLVAGL